MVHLILQNIPIIPNKRLSLIIYINPNRIDQLLEIHHSLFILLMQANRLNDKKHIKLNECLQYSKPSFLPVLPFLLFNWQLCTQEHIQPFNQIIDFSQPMLQSLCVTRSYEFLHFPFSFDGMHHVLYKKKSIILPRFVQAHEHHHFQIASPRNPFKIMCCLTGKLLAVAKDVKVFNDSISIHKHPFTGGGGA